MHHSTMKILGSKQKGITVHNKFDENYKN